MAKVALAEKDAAMAALLQSEIAFALRKVHCGSKRAQWAQWRLEERRRPGRKGQRGGGGVVLADERTTSDVAADVSQVARGWLNELA